jgi:hypothetical protein
MQRTSSALRFLGRGAFATVSDTGLTPVMGDAERAAARELSLRGVSPPVKVPGYEQEQLLGRGAYGEVWTAVNRNSGRRVAIKYFTRRGGLDWAALAREVEKLRYLFSDRYVVQLFEVGWESDPPYYVMEYMENGSLEDLLRGHRLSVHDTVALFREIAVALVHAHDKGILHCDLKPANILLDQDKKPRLADFGQSRLTNELAPALGTLFYMAPEQADLAAPPDARWDVYALGAVVYRMLTGAPPHRNSDGAARVLTGGALEAQLTAYRKLILSAPKLSAHRSVPGVDSRLAAIIDKCLEPAPSKRFPNPQAVLTALEAWNLQRVRRPLLWITGMMFVVLFCLMGLFGQYLFRTTVNTAEQGVEERTLEANQFAAQAEARQFAAHIQLWWVQLDGLARNPQLRALLQPEHPKNDPANGPKLDQLLAERKERGDRLFPAPDRSSMWFVDDAGGFQRGSAPPIPEHRYQYRGYRDYFTGLGERAPNSAPPPAGIIRGPHRSVAFRHEWRPGELVWSVAFTVPVMSDGSEPKPLGVVGLMIDLSEVAPERADRFVVLIDTRPDAKNRRGLILRHPYWADLKGQKDPPLYYADAVVKWADEAAAAGHDLVPFPGNQYTDPVSQPDGDTPGMSDFSGEWLAAVQRVRVGPEKIDTGWVVLVQERRDEALRPVRDLQWRFGYAGLVAAVVVSLLVVLMWLGMVTVMDTSARSPVTRLLRRWAGLPTSSASGTLAVTAIGGSSPPGAGTARGTATPTPGHGERGANGGG